MYGWFGTIKNDKPCPNHYIDIGYPHEDNYTLPGQILACPGCGRSRKFYCNIETYGDACQRAINPYKPLDDVERLEKEV